MYCEEKFREIYNREPETSFCPYRVCPLGAHIDHQFGPILGFALDYGVHMAYGVKNNGIIELQSMNFPKRVQFHISSVPETKEGDWGDYLRGATKAISEKYKLTKGLCGVIRGALPSGGISSSAAVTICYMKALCKVNDIELSDSEYIYLAKKAENEYVGVASGKLDQSCETLCRKNNILFMDCKDDSYKNIPLQEKMKPFKIGIFFSGLERNLANLVKELLNSTDDKIIGIDNLNDYYDVSLKEFRLKEIESLNKDFTFIKGSIADKELINNLFEKYHFNIVVNLAAQAGVRYSITNPDVYIESNMIGFYNILEACRHYPVEHLVYASSSSVYGSNKKVPYSTDDKVDNPVSLYAATKKSNELFAHAYSKLYNIPSTGLRFFTVYGPAGRPDMAYFSFTNKLIKGETIKIFNYGNCKRDFTYVDDIVKGIRLVMNKAPEKKTGEDGLPIPPYAVYNIGNNNPENLLDFVQILSEELVNAGVLPEDYDFEAHKELVPMQPGDVPITYADTSALERDFGFKPSTSLRDGLRAFAKWYKAYYM